MTEPANYIKTPKARATEDEQAEVKALLAHIKQHSLFLTPNERTAVIMAENQEHSFTGHQVALFRLISSRRKK